MILHDKLIREWAGTNGCVIPYDERCVNPASYDLKIAPSYIDMYDGSEHIATDDDPIVIYPASFFREVLYEIQKRLFGLFGVSIRHKPTAILALTVETIHIPPNMAADLKLKTTPARRGLNHTLAGWIDPGYTGKLTLTLHASKKVALQPGLRVCQVVVHRLEEDCQISYATVGHYMYQDSPTAAKDINYD